MKTLAFMLCLAASAAVAAQTVPKPAAPPAKPTSAAAKTTTAATPTTSTTGYKIPPGEKRVPGIPKTAMPGWRYQDLIVGKGAAGESGKLWHVKYKGWRAVDGVVFDSWENNRRPEMKDGKPVTGADGKPVMGEPQPLPFPQGQGRLIPGFDWGVAGMRIGCKRRIFIPWELAYGTRVIPDRPDHPGIPAKSDLIFDVELVDMTDMPAAPQRPMMPPRPGGPGAPGAPAKPGTPPPSGAPATAPAPGTPSTPPAAAPTAAPTTAPAPATTPNPGTQPESKPVPPPPPPQK